MRAPTLLLLAVAPACLGIGTAADASRPHPHSGVLTKYERVPPAKYGLVMGDVPKEELRQGKPVLKMIPIEGGYTRTCSVQDVCAPEAVVWGAINDLPNYPKMVEGVVSCEVYRRAKSGGCETTLAKYTVRASAFKVTYFMSHQFEPKKHCMTFHLDYDRLSELSDTVGYWYVEDLGDGFCRVYYSTDSQLPGWIPGFAKEAMCNLAAKRSTSWVETRCNEVTGYVPTASDGSVRKASADKGGPMGKVRLLLLALVAWRRDDAKALLAHLKAGRLFSGLGGALSLGSFPYRLQSPIRRVGTASRPAVGARTPVGSEPSV